MPYGLESQYGEDGANALNWRRKRAMTAPTPIQPVILKPQDLSLEFNHNFMKEGEWYEYTWYDGSKEAIRKVGNTIEFAEVLTNYDLECLYYDATSLLKGEVK